MSSFSHFMDKKRTERNETKKKKIFKKRHRTKKQNDDNDNDIYEDLTHHLSKKDKYVFDEIPVIGEIFDDTEEINISKLTYTIKPGVKEPEPISIQKLTGNDVSYENMQKIFKDFRFQEQTVRLCKNTPKHNEEAKVICKNIMEFIATPKNCISFVADWFRTRIFPDVSERNEILFLMIHVIFSPVLFSITSADGFIFFESFDKMNDLLDIQKHMKKTYTIVKERFAIRMVLIDDNEKCEECISLLQELSCLDKPKVDSSAKQCEMLNFAHNDYMHHFSGVFRSNLILSIIYFKLRLNMGNDKTFKNYQLMFLNIMTFINYLLYTHGKLCCVPQEIMYLIPKLIEELNKRDFFKKMNDDLYRLHKQKEVTS